MQVCEDMSRPEVNPRSLPSCFLRQGFSLGSGLTIRLGEYTASPSNPVGSVSSALGCTVTLGLLTWALGNQSQFFMPGQQTADRLNICPAWPFFVIEKADALSGQGTLPVPIAGWEEPGSLPLFYTRQTLSWAELSLHHHCTLHWPA